MIAYAEGAQRLDYDHWHQSISALSLGPRGWIQQINFFVFASIVLSTVAPWRKILIGGKGAKAFPVFIALSAISLIACGIFTQDPAPGYDPERLKLQSPTWQGLTHLLFAAVGALSSVLALLVMARRFAGVNSWDGWAVYSVLMAIAMVAFITIYGVWSTASIGYAGTFERLGLMVLPVWGLTFLIRMERGVPIMHTAEAESTTQQTT